MTLVPGEVLQPTSTVLGPSHPLAETIETLAEARRQAVTVVVIFAASLAPAALGIPWAQTAALSAAAMFCVLSTASQGDYTQTGVAWNQVGYISPHHRQRVAAPAEPLEGTGAADDRP